MKTASVSTSRLKSSVGLTLSNPVLSLHLEQAKWPPFDPLATQRGLFDWLRQKETEGVQFPNHVKKDFFFILDDTRLKPTSDPRVVGLLVDRESK